MDIANDDLDKTMLFRPGSVPPASPAAAVEVRQIAGLGAINPIVAAANPLLMMVPTLRTASAPGDIATLRARLIEYIQDFEAACVRQAVPDDQRNIAKYALCTVVDEAVQMTPWGGTANWAQRSLLIHFFRENWGGEKFFQLLDKMAQTPARFAHVLELFSLCLSLGFMGRFQLLGAAGRQSLAEVRERLYVLTRQGRAEPGRTLSPQWRGVAVAARKFHGFAAAGVAAAAALLVGLAAFAWYVHALGDRMAGLELDQLALRRTPVDRAALVPAARPRLAQLLAPQVQRRELQVRDLQLESVVTMPGETVFDSGSAQPTRRAVELLARVAQALDQLEGPVLVTGHTDNVPTRTLRFPSNFELSRERAANVKSIIAAHLRDPARIRAEGKGDTEPVAPNDSAQGRAQNRRVEVILRVPSATP